MRPEAAALFHEVADLAAADRADYYLHRQVPDALRAEVESLLEHDVAGDSLRGCVESAERLLIESSAPDSHTQPGRTGGIVPATIGRFEVARLLGRGGMGEVYLARDPLIDRPVAIKLLGPGHEGDAGRRLVREARAAGRLHHPNIVTVFEAGEHDGRAYIAMEYVPGETIGSLIRRHAPLSLRRRLEMIEGACAGLAHAHREGVIHLDIKPDNLMLDDNGTVKVLDFGISRIVQSDTLATLHGAGTLRYMSPEQIQGKPLDHRSDVFSLACSLFELVSYTPAFTGSTKEIVTQIASGPVPSLLDVSPRIDSRLDDIVSRALALDPAERYDDLEELRAALAEVRAGVDPALDEPQPTSVLDVAAAGSPHASGTSKSRRSTRRRSASRSPAVVAGAAATAAVMIAIAAFVWSGRRNAPEPAAAAAPVATVAVPSAFDRTPVVEPSPPTRVREEPITPREQARGPAPAPDVTTPAISAAEPAPPTVETPQLVVPTSEPVLLPAPVPPSTPERVPVAAATAVAPPVEVPSDSDAILETLRSYDAAYRSLDVGAVLKVFPSLGNAQVEQLRRTFAGMNAYEMNTQVVDAKVTGDAATVLARVARRMAPRVGSAVVNEVQTEFRLQRSGRNWVVVGVTTR